MTSLDVLYHPPLVDAETVKQVVLESGYDIGNAGGQVENIVQEETEQEREYRRLMRMNPPQVVSPERT